MAARDAARAWPSRSTGAIVNKDALPPNAIVADGYGIAQNILGTALCYRTDKYPGGGPEIVGGFLGREEISRCSAACA